MNTTPTTEETKTYDFPDGDLVKHWVTYSYARPVTLVHYTVIKDGVESKKYRTVGHAMNFLNKKQG